MSTGRRLLAGAGWAYGSLISVVLFQFGYAAVTSRVLDEHAFGTYAIAVAVTGFINLLATGGLGQSVGRMVDLERGRLRSLLTFATILGVSGAVLVFATAPLWATVWGSSDAVPAIQLFAISALLAPALGLSTGLMRRLGRFRALAISTFVTNLVGMAGGLIAVVLIPRAESLLVFPLVTQTLALTAALLLSNRLLWGFGALRDSRHDISFSWRITISSLLSYGVVNINRIGVSNFIGPAALGQWNRADVVSAVPFQQIQGSLVQTIYPEFRHDLENPVRARAVWTDLLALTAWFALPLGAVAAVVVPQLIPILFGPGWELARSLSAVICVAASIQIVGNLLASAVEALGRFTWVWVAQGSLLVLQLVSFGALLITHEIFVAMIALVATQVLQHILYLAFCAAHGYIDLGRLALRYGIAALAAITCGLIAWLVVWLVAIALAGHAHGWLGAIATIVVTAAALWLTRRRLLPFQLAIRYGILRPPPKGDS